MKCVWFSRHILDIKKAFEGLHTFFLLISALHYLAINNKNDFLRFVYLMFCDKNKYFIFLWWLFPSETLWKKTPHFIAKLAWCSGEIYINYKIYIKYWVNLSWHWIKVLLNGPGVYFQQSLYVFTTLGYSFVRQDKIGD